VNLVLAIFCQRILELTAQMKMLERNYIPLTQRGFATYRFFQAKAILYYAFHSVRFTPEWAPNIAHRREPSSLSLLLEITHM
jgi:hypothetical protein